MNAPAKIQPATFDAKAQRFTVAELVNEGRKNPLFGERAERQFMFIDGLTRSRDVRCPIIGAPDLRHPLERMFSRAAANGVTVVVSPASSISRAL